MHLLSRKLYIEQRMAIMEGESACMEEVVVICLSMYQSVRLCIE